VSCPVVNGQKVPKVDTPHHRPVQTEDPCLHEWDLLPASASFLCAGNVGFWLAKVQEGSTLRRSEAVEIDGENQHGDTSRPLVDMQGYPWTQNLSLFIIVFTAVVAREKDRRVDLRLEDDHPSPRNYSKERLRPRGYLARVELEL